MLCRCYQYFGMNRLEYSFSPEHKEQEFLKNGGNHLQDYIGPSTRPQPNFSGCRNLIAITSQNSPRGLERICYELRVEGYIWKCVTIFNSTHQLRSETSKFQSAKYLLPCVIYGICRKVRSQYNVPFFSRSCRTFVWT